VPHHRRGPDGSQFAHLHGELDPYESPVPLQAGNRPATGWPLFHPIRQMFVRQDADCIGADEVSSRLFLFGNEAYYILPKLRRMWSSPKRQRVMKVVNLNQYRKRRRHSEAERRAVENRVSFGRTKAERSKDLSDSARAIKESEGKRLD
jgi:Domain of unknown function (DUF4169)